MHTALQIRLNRSRPLRPRPLCPFSIRPAMTLAVSAACVLVMVARAAGGTIYVAPGGDDAHDGSSWTLAKRTVQAAIDAAALDGGEVWVQAGTYVERIILRS